MRKGRNYLIYLLLLSFANAAFADLIDSYEVDSLPSITNKVHKTPKKNKAVTQEVPANKKNVGKNTSIHRDPKQRGPVYFRGLGLTGLKGEGLVELHKNVIVTQDDFRLESDEAKIYLDEESNEVKRVLAEKEVKITKRDETSGKFIKAFGDSAEFDNRTQLITLRGKARVIKGEDVLTGTVIFYNLETGWIKVDKVKGVVNP